MDRTASLAFLDYWKRIRGRTRRVAAAIPARQVEWTHLPGKFTLGDLVRHLAAAERWLFTESAMGRPVAYPGHGVELAEGLPATLAYLDAMHAESCALLGTLTEAQWASPCRTPAGAEITTWKWLRAMVEHEVHHRGQLYMMLGMLGVETPPLYGLTEEQVREASIRP